MKKKKILFDISHTIHGHTGIQQDLRWTLETLISSNIYDVDLLVYDMVCNYEYLNFNYEKAEKMHGKYIAQAKLLSYFFNTGSKINQNARFPIGWLRRRNFERMLRKKNNFTVTELIKDFNEPVLRKLIAQDISFLTFNKLLERKIIFSNLSSEALVKRMNMDKYDLPVLNIKGYDVAIFIQEFPILLPSPTKKIVRTYDFLQITAPDVVYMADYKAAYQYKSIRHCIDQKSTFVTISNTVEKELKKIFKKDIDSCVIPCIVSDGYQYKKIKMNNIFHSYGIKNKISISKYILSVSTIEPRKNIYNIYKAFKLLKEDSRYINYKLVLIGSRTWYMDNIINLMLGDKDVVLVKDVLTEDMPFFYSNAELLVSIPFKEGFGLPPIEAMLCNCLVLSSDIPVHREIQGDASEYVNPYHVESIKDKMKSILSMPKKEKDIRKQLGLKQAQNYTQEVVKKLWTKLLNEKI